MQIIVMHLVFQDLAWREPNEHSPWLECRAVPEDRVMDMLARQDHRRCIKTHLPLDGLPWRPGMRYIVVGRDPRDVLMSMWNHYSNFTPEWVERINALPDRVGPPMPPCPPDVHAFWTMTLTRGWFDWETEGYPNWSILRNFRTWWDWRHLPNILFVHFNDLLADPAAEIARIARFCDIPCAPRMARAIADATRFARLRQDAIRNDRGGKPWKEGAATFFHKGTNGRWRDTMTEADLALYAKAAERELSDDLRRWLETGARDARAA